MYDLSRFRLSDMTECGAALRALSAHAGSLTEAAERIVRFLYDRLAREGTGARSCALVRFFKTHPYGALNSDQQSYAIRMLGYPPESADMPCLTLFGTVGDEPEWNSPEQSAGHRVIPLAGEGIVARLPMISQLIQQFGIDVATVLNPEPALLVDAEQRNYNVFHVADARGSPYVPAQEEFVIPYSIESVLGFGGLLPGGDLYAIILFSRDRIARETAEMFRTLALNVKVAILPFVGRAL